MWQEIFLGGRLLVSRRLAVILAALSLGWTNVPVGQANQQTVELKLAAKLFEQKRHSEALPLLERLAASNPKDDQAVYGLGIALLMTADEMDNTRERSRLFAQSLAVLEKAAELGVDDSHLVRMLIYLRRKDNQSRSEKEILASEAVMIMMHPPLVFDTDPPQWIRLLDDYRHKSAVDFEGNIEGMIWKPGGLKITYEAAGLEPAEEVQRIPKDNFVWYRERTVNNRQIKYGLTKKNKVIVTINVGKPDEIGIWNFSADIKSPTDIQDALIMITGFPN